MKEIKLIAVNVNTYSMPWSSGTEPREQTISAVMILRLRWSIAQQ